MTSSKPELVRTSGGKRQEWIFSLSLIGEQQLTQLYMAASPEQNTNTISDLGETELIRRFFEGQPMASPLSAIGIGDDCAILDYQPGYKLLVTTDQLVERVHFLKDKSSARDIGYKSVAVNFSDIAAVGGQPMGLFLSLALPGNTSVSWLQAFREGLFELCSQYDVPLLGGDTTGSRQDILINVAVLGRVQTEKLKLRSDAQNGDILCVTGPLGDSAAGLKLLTGTEHSVLNEDHQAYLLNRHLRPHPGLEEGNWLGEEEGVHAMMDLSDGLATDAGHIATRSSVGFDIELDRLPLSEAFKAFMSREKDKAIGLALHGGEDYHLLCTIAEGHYPKVARRFEKKFGSTLYAVGKATSEHKGLQYLKNGKPVQVSGKEFDHFNI